MPLRDHLLALQAAKPEIALGLGVVQGGSEPDIMTSGPLWKGASETVGPDASWHIGSITKTFTATAVMQLAERGLLDLDRPISDHLGGVDDMHPRWQSLTLAQLLSHTGGLAANPALWQFKKWSNLPSVEGRQKVLASAWAKPPKRDVGQQCYSNLGYMLAGYVIEKTMESPWEDIIRHYIAAPLGLDTLGFGPPDQPLDPRGHARRFFRLSPKERDDISSDNPPWLGPAGTLHMSIADLLTFGRAHLKAMQGEMPEFLSQESSLRMQTPVLNNYGLGLIIQDNTLWHNGSNTFWYALLMIDPISDAVIVATQNAMFRLPKIDAMVQDVLTDLRR